MTKDELATQTEKVLDYINTSLFSTIFIAFIFWWLFKNAQSRSKKIPLFFFIVSILSGATADWILIFLCSKFDIDKASIEKIGFFDGVYIEDFLYGFDLVKIYNTLLMTAQILKISILFWTVSSWSPKNIYETNKFSKASTYSIAKYYAVLRIPIVVLLMNYKNTIQYSSLAFIRMFLFGTEIGACSLFFVILKTRYQGSLERDNRKGSYGGINVLIVLLQFDAFFNYMVYTMSTPLPLSEFATYIVEKLGFITNMLVNIILITILKPQWIRNSKHEELKSEKNNVDLVSLKDIGVIGMV